MNQPTEQKHDLAEPTLNQWTWKTPAMAKMAVAVCKLAIEKAGGEFSANDLPEFTHGGGGICGCVFNQLIEFGILARVGLFDGATFLPKIVFNKGGNKIGVYRLASGGLARALLAVHDHEEQPQTLKQGEML